MSDTPRFDVRTTTVDGKTQNREIMHRGQKIDDIGEHETIELIMKLTSSLRFSLPTTRYPS